jgi:hypothetical protein
MAKNDVKNDAIVDRQFMENNFGLQVANNFRYDKRVGIKKAPNAWKPL